MASSNKMLAHQITQEEFNIFHTIDRQLFSILIFSLGKDPTHAIRVMGLWIWLERITLKSSIVSTIRYFKYQTIDTLFEESMLCLHVATFGPTVNDNISVLTTFLRGKSIEMSLLYFHENCTLVLHGVGRIVEDVCARAFKDILDQFKNDRGVSSVGRVAVDGSRLRQGMYDFDAYNFGLVSKDYDEVNEQDDVEELFMRLNHLSLDSTPVEDRLGEGREISGRGSSNKTLFLTFSKGYPISKNEVREFFTRLFGDIIEGLHMQEVERNEQPLYARLVVRDISMVNLVLQGHKKIKFSINGKHACVRKYVHKRSESPPTPRMLG